ncbi:hypothetical protein GCM10010472_60170 [Pseudonocardia halophobica]|uniref:Camelysin metallo-endopeptidase n=1 Tax=Pseudonocardia halophobica TaxID=29401 RepID=A0A9W6UFT2_9PSEU|nr:TasA family protein [Pseudonocardia halophobica]GLL15564.1 hypothetical protein GCM10017577_67160 [Pseudonocardia halophobica]
MAVQSEDKKNRKRKAGLIVGLVALVVAAAAIGAGTYAAFSDTETGPSGTIGAGTLDLEVGSAPANATLFSASNIAPGYVSPTPVTITVRNAGTIAGTLSNSLTVNGGDGSCPEPESELTGGCKSTGDLQDYLMVEVTGSPSGATVGKTKLADFVSGKKLPTGGTLEGGKSATYTLVFSLPADTGNIVQGDTVTLNSTFNLDQVTS